MALGTKIWVLLKFWISSFELTSDFIIEIFSVLIIGILTNKSNSPSYPYKVHYLNEGESRIIRKNEITFFSKNLKDLEKLIMAKNYNLWNI